MPPNAGAEKDAGRFGSIAAPRHGQPSARISQAGASRKSGEPQLYVAYISIGNVISKKGRPLLFRARSRDGYAEFSGTARAPRNRRD